jgi:protocatechuate 3,4-dioxygenase beta subunit
MSLMRRLVVFVIVVGAVTSMRATQSAPRGATIQGRTLNAITREPVRGAMVAFNQERGPDPSAAPEIEFLTDVNGRFVFNDLALGRYGFVVTKTGYVTLRSDQIPATTREPAAVVEIALTPEAIIAGTIVDSTGEPIPNVTVQATPSTAKTPRPPSTTDGYGRYSIGGLAAGEYVVSTRQPSASGGTTTYYPATAKAEDATPLVVKTGEERTGVDFTLAMSGLVPEPTKGTLTLAGSPSTVAGVVRDRNGRGLSGAMVALIFFDLVASSRGELRMTVSEPDGRFRFDEVPPGRFRVTAGRPGFFVLAADFLAATMIDLAPGQSILDVSVTMTKLVTVSGTVRDQYGDPVSTGVVLSSIGGGPSRRSTSDSHGRYSIADLSPGEYLVAAGTSSAGRRTRMFDDSGVERSVAYKPMYYPGVADASIATPVAIADRDVAGLDLVLRPALASTVSVIVDPGGLALENVQLQTASVEAVGGRRWWTVVPPDLAPAVVQGVPAGQYTFIASGFEPDEAGSRGRAYWAREDLRTDGLASPTLRLQLEPAARVAGRVLFDGTSTPPFNVMVSLRPLQASDFPMDFSNQASQASGARFSIDGVMPGRFVIDAGDRSGPLQGGWILKSAIAGGRDVMDLPIDLTSGASLDDVVLTFADRPSATEVSGTVLDGAGRPVADTMLVVFPTDSRYWHDYSHRIRPAISDRGGHYALAGLPPGNYGVAALTGAPSGRISSMLAKLGPTATVFTVADGEHKIVDVRRAK